MEAGDGGDDVIGIVELEEQVSGERWQNTLRSTARSSKLDVKNRKKKSDAGPSRSTSYSL